MGTPLPWTDGILRRISAKRQCYRATNCGRPCVRTMHKRSLTPFMQSGLEERQVVLDLPRRHLLVVGRPLVLLRLHVVVDVVLGAGVAERLAHDRVLLQVAG